MVCLFPLLSLAETYNIVMVDASGSMAGMGGGNNIFPKVKKQVAAFSALSSMKGWKTEIVPFSNFVHTKFVGNLIICRGNTNIYGAVLYAQRHLGKGRSNVFLITDGMHNMQFSVDSLCFKLTEIKESNNAKDSVFYYYVALDAKAKHSPLAQVFDGNNNFMLLDSLYVPRQVSRQVSSKTTVRPVVKVKVQNATVNSIHNGWSWKIVLFVLSALLLLLLLIWFLLPLILSLNISLLAKANDCKGLNGVASKALLILGSSTKGFLSFMNQPIREKMRQIQRLTNYIYNQPEEKQKRLLDRLSSEMREKVENVRDNQFGRLPSEDKGRWSGERGNSIFCISDEAEWINRRTHEVVRVRDLRKKYKIAEPIKVEYRNGEPIFDKYSIAETKVPYKENYDYGNLEDLHNPVNDNLNKELSPSLLDKSAVNPARDYVENAANDGSRCHGCRNTYHEKRDGETIQAIPDFIHDICSHNGGRSLAALVQK